MDFHITRGYSGSRLGLLLHHQVWRFPLNQYVLGFAFDHAEQQVLLINKQRPDWQKGRVNGIGGKIEIDETALEAMTREFNEETGLYSDQNKWRLFCQLTGYDYSVYCYATEMPIIRPFCVTDERPEWFDYSCLPLNVNDNLWWLIPMAMAKVPVYAEVDEGAHNAHC
jgi:8-oxo-dGTP diphosphatase